MDADANDGGDTTYFQRGSSFDVASFLEHHYKSGEWGNWAGRADFKGKVVMICCFSLPLRPSTTDYAIAQAVSLVSTELYDLGAFQLIVLLNYRCLNFADVGASFADFRSCLPPFHLIVPLSASPTMLEALNFSGSSEPTGLLVNRSQTVEWHRPIKFLLEYGADAFPFTTVRLAQIAGREKHNVLWRRLTWFLCSPPLPFPRYTSSLRKSIGTRKKCIHDLEHKFVGLYLCQTGSLIPKLDTVHKRCRDVGLEFEIILVYMPFKDYGDPQLFQDHINSVLKKRNISWWVLPFSNWVSRRLWRLSHKGDDDRLVIVDPKSKFAELHGEAVLCHLGIMAYPFSRERLLNRELERLKEVTLKKLVCELGDPLLWKGSDCTYRVPMTALCGKNVLLYLHCVEDHSSKYFDKLISYCQRKEHDPNFEAVFVGLDTTSLCYPESSCANSLLVCPPNPKHSDFVTRLIFRKGGKCSTVVVFGEDGLIIYLRPMRLVCSFCLDFPFSDHLPNEKSAELFDKKLPFEFTEWAATENAFKALLPLLGKEYFFPDIPLGGRMKPPQEQDVYFSADAEHDKCFGSILDYTIASDEVALYPNEMHWKIPNTDSGKFDVVSFLSTDNRDYLVRNDTSRTRFQVDSLGDKKWVMICCFFCPNFFNSPYSLECRAVSNVCSELYEKCDGSFEMVLVFKMRGDFQADYPAFIHMLSGFPSSCLVVPFWDLHSRDSICCSLDFSGAPKGLFLHADIREVIWHRELGYFVRYGVDTFPFTEEDFKKTDEEFCKSWNCRSLDNLLCCSPEEVLKKLQDSSEGGSIKLLQKKVVGVYLCVEGSSIPILHELCIALNMELEIVVVYLPFHTSNSDPCLFQYMINRALEKRKISWWIVPFRSWVSRRLSRLCGTPCVDELIILGKGVVDPNGSNFLRKFEEALGKDPSSSMAYSFSFRGPNQRKVIDEFKSRYQQDPSSRGLKALSLGGGRLEHVAMEH